MAPLTKHPLSVVQVRRWTQPGHLWAVLDATDTPAVLTRVRALGPGRAVSLYRGRAEEDLEAIAPYLVQLDEATYDWITRELWSGPWGIFLVANGTQESVRHHLRQFLVVQSPEGESWYFRFYDPRVLERFLPTCTPAELEQFCGPIRAFGITDPTTYGVTIMRPGEALPSRPAPIVVRR